MLKLYPFAARLLLYQVPLIMINLLVGMEFIYFFLKRIIQPKRILLAVFLIFPALQVNQLLDSYPFRHEELKDSLSFVSRNIKPGEKIYIYYGAKPVYEYYSYTSKFNMDEHIVDGSGDSHNLPEDLVRLKRLRGAFWIVFSHDYRNEEAIIIDFLNSKGILKNRFTTVKSSAYLFFFKIPVCFTVNRSRIVFRYHRYPEDRE